LLKPALLGLACILAFGCASPKSREQVFLEKKAAAEMAVMAESYRQQLEAEKRVLQACIRMLQDQERELPAKLAKACDADDPEGCWNGVSPAPQYQLRKQQRWHSAFPLANHS
jgi:hypothetical protein